MSEDTVAHAMHRGVVTCHETTNLGDVVRILGDSDITAVIVTGNAGEVRGIVSHMDILRHYGEDLSTKIAADVMTRDVLHVGPETSLKEAVAIMLRHHVHRLVVTQDSPGGLQAIGILSTTDVIRHLRGVHRSWHWD
jgi:CBS domain-containing protein